MLFKNNLSITLIIFCLIITFYPLAAIAQEAKDVKQSDKAPSSQSATTLEQGKPIERELKGGESHSYEIKLEANQYLHAVVEQKEIDVGVAVYAPDGKKVYDIIIAYGSEPVYLIAENSGIYKLEIYALQKDAKTYKVQIKELRIVTDSDKPRVIAYQTFSQAELLGLQSENDIEKFKQTIAKHQKAISLFQSINDQFGEANSYRALGLLYSAKGDYINAESSYKMALGIQEKILGVDHLAVADIYESLARLYFYKIDITNAESSYKKALTIYKKILGENHPGVGDAYNNLVSLYMFKGDYTNAELIIKKVLDISEKTLGSDHPYVAYNCTLLGYLYYLKGYYTNADLLYKRALSIYEKTLNEIHEKAYDEIYEKASVSDYFSFASLCASLSDLYKAKGDYTNAEFFLKKALAIAEKVSLENMRTAYYYLSLGNLYQVKGDYTDAEFFLKKALAMNEKILFQEHPNVISCYESLAKLYQAKGDYTNAEPLYKKVFAMREKVFGSESFDASFSCASSGDFYKTKGDYTNAESLYKRALAIREKVLGDDDRNTAFSCISLGNLYQAKGDYKSAEPLYKRALAIREKIFGLENFQIADSYFLLGNLYRVKGDIKESIFNINKGNDIREKNFTNDLIIGSERQKLAYISQTAYEQDQTISLNLQLAPNDLQAAQSAMNTILRRKARALDAIAQNIEALRQRFKPEDQKLIDELTSKRAYLAKLTLDGPGKENTDSYKTKLKDLMEEIDKLESEISYHVVEFRAQTLPINIETVQKVIPKDSVLIEFVTYRTYDAKADKYGTSRYAVYTLQNNGELNWADLGEAETIDKAVKGIREVLVKQTDGSLSDINKEVQPRAAVLYQLLMKPVIGKIGNKEHLLIAPDGQLNLIPFDMLVDEKAKYLVENYFISYLTSGRDLLRLQNNIEKNQPPIIMANPLFGKRTLVVQSDTNKREKPEVANQYFVPLIGTAQEAEALSKIIPEAQIYTQAEANKENLKKANAPRILHIATHGFFLSNEPIKSSETRSSNFSLNNGEELTRAAQEAVLKTLNPLLRSGIALAGANQNTEKDGILTALEATGLNLWGTKLVVLSACNTALGEVKSGEGVQGFRRALVLAGSETQMMSLWPVSDFGTRDLMIGYYQNLKNGMGRGAALRDVQLKMIANPKKAHPFYWASFIQSGEWGNISGKR